MSTQVRALVIAALAILNFSATAVHAATVGNDAVERGRYDTFGNFGLALTDVVSPNDGTITEWSVYTSRGDLALLLLRPTGTAGEYTLVDMDARIANPANNEPGVQTYASDITVSTGDVLGLFLGTAKVSYELDSRPNVCNGLDCDVLYTNNGGLLNLGTLLNTTIQFGGSTDRTYSLNATITPVPLPAAGLMLLTAIGGLTLVRRRAQN
ncbi:MAG: VPLPA-CTERM sorting domain-containing protein [Pseudomonadota bacterium]